MRATDARGECALNVRGSLDFIPVSVEKAGYFPVQRSADPRQVVEIRLHRTATLVGRLLAADTGELVPGARIRIEHPGCTGCERDTARADPDGRYELAGVPLRLAGTRIHLVAEGFAAETRRLEIRSDEERIDQDFQLERGVVLEGRVIDFVTGGAVPGASVSEQPTDELGRFRLRVLPRGIEQWVGLRVRAPGYCELQGGCTPDTCLSGELLELRLPRSATVEGCVSDPSGAPVAGAEVWLVGDRRRRAAESNSGNATPLDELPADWNLSSEGERARASTDAGGCFEITNAVPWTSGWLVEARCEGFEPVRVELERTPGPTERVRLDLVLVPRVDSPDGTVKGLVTLNGAFRYELSGEVRWKGPTRSGSDTFHNGAYHQDVEPGKVELSIEVDSLSGLLRGDTLVVDVAQGEELRRDVDVRVPAAAIRGRVTHPDGQPVGDVEVSACSEVRAWKQLFSARTDRQGAYSIEVPDWVPSYRVTVALAGLELEARAVRAGSRGIDFTLPKAGKVHLRARTTDTGRLVDGWVFDVLARSGEERSFQPLELGVEDADGWFELTLPAGVYDLLLLPGRSDLSPVFRRGVPFRAEQEAPARVELELRMGLELQVLAAPGAGELPPEIRVFLLEEDWGDVRSLVADGPFLAGLHRRRVEFEESGRWLAQGLTPGRLEFRAFPDDLVIEPATIELTERGPRSVEIRWRSAR